MRPGPSIQRKRMRFGPEFRDRLRLIQSMKAKERALDKLAGSSMPKIQSNILESVHSGPIEDVQQQASKAMIPPKTVVAEVPFQKKIPTSLSLKIHEEMEARKLGPLALRRKASLAERVNRVTAKFDITAGFGKNT